MPLSLESLTPREIVRELDRYIVGQDAAKRAVAVALRNRWRRQKVGDELRDEIYPKNILMMGPTGVGKTEIARRLAKLAAAPFLKVEATKFTEVGYVGRDVESMVRDLVEVGIGMVRAEHAERVRSKAQRSAEDRMLDLLAKSEGIGGGMQEREAARRRLRAGELDELQIETQLVDRSQPNIGNVGKGPGNEEWGMHLSSLFQTFSRDRKRMAKLKVREALRAFAEEEADKLLDRDAIQNEALERTQQHGIIFLDELDKVARREGGHGPDVSREGVQRDLLPIVEGSTVNTKYGPVSTEHVLFIAAGAFHVSKPSDLIPELQGRFPIRVELEPLRASDFARILREPRNSLVSQYVALLETEGITIRFHDDAVEEIAQMADQVNSTVEDIGARRLHTIMERVFEEVAFHAPDMPGAHVDINAEYVRQRLGDVVANEDLSRYVL